MDRMERDRKLTARVFNDWKEAEEADVEYYRSMTPEERIAIVEMLRQQWYKIHGETEQGLRRVVRIVRR